MKSLKIILLALAVISVVILGGIGYVWKNIAFNSGGLKPMTDAFKDTFTVEKLPELPASTTGTEELKVAPENDTSTSTAPLLTAPVTVSTEQLPENQKKVLDTLGISEKEFTITPEMVECAIDVVGETRALEIEKGASPSLSEGLTLLVCLKK